MSGPLRQQRLLASTLLHHAHPTPTLPYLHHQQRRTFISKLFGRRNKTAPRSATPMLDELLKKPVAQQKQDTARGALSSSSLFAPEAATALHPTAPALPNTPQPRASPPDPAATAAATALVTDPAPRRRELWQRKRVIRSARHKGRVTPAELVRKTEREVVMRSHGLKTSVKKLGPLARQIAGRSVDEAIAQMRFSPKKAAREVREHLEHARDVAVVGQGMGLGLAGGEGPVTIQKKDGSRYVVKDLSRLYVDQAWVGKGPHGKMVEPRARGQTNLLIAPWTHITLKLKEETTLVREHREREAKRTRKRLGKVWVQLPDRYIHGQNQYYGW